jgi:hypothetical protein
MSASHVTRTVSQCFAALRQLSIIRQSVPRKCFQLLVLCLAAPRLWQRDPPVPAVSIRNENWNSINIRCQYTLCQPHWLRAVQQVHFKKDVHLQMYSWNGVPSNVGVDLQARSQDLLATRAMPILSSHADGEANNCVKKLSFDHLGNPGSFVGNPSSARVCPCLATGLNHAPI